MKKRNWEYYEKCNIRHHGFLSNWGRPIFRKWKRNYTIRNCKLSQGAKFYGPNPFITKSDDDLYNIEYGRADLLPPEEPNFQNWKGGKSKKNRKSKKKCKSKK